MAKKTKTIEEVKEIISGVSVNSEVVNVLEIGLDDMTKEELINNDKSYSKIYVTTDYSKFKLIKGNRTLHKSKYLQLLKSMETEQLMIPIAVNDKFEVIDGQHRYNACRELKKPVYYYICDGYGIEQVKRANLVSSNWTKEDYLNLHTTDGLVAYEEFEDILLESGLNVYDLIKVYAQAQEKSSEQLAYEFTNGSLVNDNIEKVTGFITALKDFEFFKYYKKKQFVAAFIKLYFDPRYDQTRMVKRLKSRDAVLKELSSNVTKDEYLAKLANGIYSFGAGKNNLYYDINNKRFYQ